MSDNLDIILEVKAHANTKERVEKTLADIAAIIKAKGGVLGESLGNALSGGVGGKNTKEVAVKVADAHVMAYKVAAVSAQKRIDKITEDYLYGNAGPSISKSVIKDRAKDQAQQLALGKADAHITAWQEVSAKAKLRIDKITEDYLYGNAGPSISKSVIKDRAKDQAQQLALGKADAHVEAYRVAAMSAQKRMDKITQDYLYGNVGPTIPKSISNARTAADAPSKPQGLVAQYLAGSDDAAQKLGKLQSAAEKMNEAFDNPTRGKFHQWLAKTASLAFELGGAFFFVSTALTAIGGGAIFGIKFMKDIEDAKMGIAGTVLSMNLLANSGMGAEGALRIADRAISDLEQDSLKYNVSLADTSKLFQAIVGPGTAAGMTLEQVGKTATIGAVAVKAMGLNSTQVVQEIRDLVQGGIQPASSTLATALGLRDADIKAAKASSEGLFAFLEKRMEGFAIIGMERNKTLSGSWDFLINKVQRLFADPAIYQTVINAIQGISDAIATIERDENGNFKGLKFNPELVESVKVYMSAIGTVIQVLGALAKALLYIGPLLVNLAPVALLGFFGSKLPAAVGTTVTSMLGLGTATKTGVGALETFKKSFGSYAFVTAEVAAATGAKIITSVEGSANVMIKTEGILAKSVGRIKLLMASLGPGGIIGLVIGTAMMMPWERWFDQLFLSIEERTKKSYEAIRKLGTGAAEDQLQEVSSELSKLSSGGKLSLLWNDGRILELEAKERALKQRLVETRKLDIQDAAQQLATATIKEGRDASARVDVELAKGGGLPEYRKNLSDATEELLKVVKGLAVEESLANLTAEESASIAERRTSAIQNYRDNVNKATTALEKFNAEQRDKTAKKEDQSLALRIIDTESLQTDVDIAAGILDKLRGRELADATLSSEARTAIERAYTQNIQALRENAGGAAAIINKFVQDSGIKVSDTVLERMRSNLDKANAATKNSAKQRSDDELDAAKKIIAANDAVYESKMRAAKASTFSSDVENLAAGGAARTNASGEFLFVSSWDENGNYVGDKNSKLKAFATGGSFMVGGSGGTDTSRVEFMATPGERVIVQTPEQQRNSGETNITIQINGSDDPNRVADAVVKAIQQKLVTRPNLLSADNRSRRTG